MKDLYESILGNRNNVIKNTSTDVINGRFVDYIRYNVNDMKPDEICEGILKICKDIKGIPITNTNNIKINEKDGYVCVIKRGPGSTPDISFIYSKRPKTFYCLRLDGGYADNMNRGRYTLSDWGERRFSGISDRHRLLLMMGRWNDWRPGLNGGSTKNLSLMDQCKIYKVPVDMIRPLEEIAVDTVF